MDWGMRAAAVTLAITCGVVSAGPGLLHSAVAAADPDDGNDNEGTDDADHPVADAIKEKIRHSRAGGTTGRNGSSDTASGGIPRAANLPPVPISPGAHTIVIRRETAPAVPVPPAPPESTSAPIAPRPATIPVRRTPPPNSINVPGIGEVVLTSAVADKYRQAGGAAVLGPPTGQPQRVADGTVQTFANGNIYTSPATGPHLVRGQILKTYLAEGGPAGPSGFPMTDEFEVCGHGPSVAHGGWGGEFENNYIWWLNWGDANRTFSAYVTGKDGSPGCECGKDAL